MNSAIMFFHRVITQERGMNNENCKVLHWMSSRKVVKVHNVSASLVQWNWRCTFVQHFANTFLTYLLQKCVKKCVHVINSDLFLAEIASQGSATQIKTPTACILNTVVLILVATIFASGPRNTSCEPHKNNVLTIHFKSVQEFSSFDHLTTNSSCIKMKQLRLPGGTSKLTPSW